MQNNHERYVIYTKEKEKSSSMKKEEIHKWSITGTVKVQYIFSNILWVMKISIIFKRKLNVQ